MATRANSYELADILQRELWSQDLINKSPELLTLFESGILIKDPRLDTMCKSMDAGTMFEVPYIQEPNYTEPNISDDSPTLATVEKIVKARMMAFMGNYNKVWGSADIARMLDSGTDFFTIIRNFTARYWKKDIENRIMSSSIGILNSNVANNASDLFNDQSGVNWTYDMYVDTNQLRGDHGVSGLSFMFMHSSAYSAIKKADSARRRAVLDENGKHIYTLYDEKSIIMVSDLLPFDGTNATVVMANRGSFAYSESTDIIEPLELNRNPLLGNGGGDEVVVSRKRYMVHPQGYSFTGTTQATSTGLTLAETQDATNWTRAVDRKQSNLSFLRFAV